MSHNKQEARKKKTNQILSAMLSCLPRHGHIPHELTHPSPIFQYLQTIGGIHTYVRVYVYVGVSAFAIL